MLCSDCQRVIRPVVALDIDGTLGDYHTHFQAFAEMYLGMPLRRGFDGEGDFGDYMGLPKHVYREIRLSYRQGGQEA